MTGLQFRIQQLEIDLALRDLEIDGLRGQLAFEASHSQRSRADFLMQRKLDLHALLVRVALELRDNHVVLNRTGDELRAEVGDFVQ